MNLDETTMLVVDDDRKCCPTAAGIALLIRPSCIDERERAALFQRIRHVPGRGALTGRQRRLIPRQA
jgi:hypothetical protein